VSPAPSAPALPAWSIDREAASAHPLRCAWPLADARTWAWGGATGAGGVLDGLRRLLDPP
jgi:hypothetical protein